MLKYKIKYTEAILWNSTGKLLWFKITKMLIVSFFCNFPRIFVPYKMIVARVNSGTKYSANRFVFERRRLLFCYPKILSRYRYS